MELPRKARDPFRPRGSSIQLLTWLSKAVGQFIDEFQGLGLLDRGKVLRFAGKRWLMAMMMVLLRSAKSLVKIRCSARAPIAGFGSSITMNEAWR